MGNRNKRASGATEAYDAHLRPTRRNTTTNRTAILERMYQRLGSELAMNRFKWSGLPDNIDVRFLERTLFRDAQAVFFHERDMDAFLVMQGGGNGIHNYQDQPTTFHVIGANYPGKTLKADEVVPIYANYERMPDLDIVYIYASKLANIDRTIEINTNSARRNKILVMQENQRLSVENINRQIDEGNAAIRVAAPLQDMSFIQALDLGVHPDSLEKLHILRTRLWNEFMGLLGIENANQDKKERLVANEVDANNDQTSMMRNVNLNERRNAAERINEKFGSKASEFISGMAPFEVSVEYWTDVERMAKLPEIGNPLSTTLEEG